MKHLLCLSDLAGQMPELKSSQNTGKIAAEKLISQEFLKITTFSQQLKAGNIIDRCFMVLGRH